KSLSDNSQNDLRRTSPCHSREGGNDSDRHILHEIWNYRTDSKSPPSKNHYPKNLTLTLTLTFQFRL
ncbi:MAG: hypothetical protein V2A61_05840, partial [Calditrichota bacterium]